MGEVDFHPRITQIHIKSLKNRYKWSAGLEIPQKKTADLKFSRDENKPRVSFLCVCVVQEYGREEGERIPVVEKFFLEGILNFGLKTCGLCTHRRQI